MAYYDAFVAAWNNPTQPPPGATGVPITAGMTTQQKLDTVNAWTNVGSIPTSFYVTGDQVFNCIDKTEFFALTAAAQQNVLLMCAVTPGQLLGGSAETAHLCAGMILQYFTNLSGPTISNFTKLAKATVVPWWSQANKPPETPYQRPFDMGDVTAAGVS